MRKSIYQPLTDFRASDPSEYCRLSFAEIENIIGAKLPSSADTHPYTFWCNSNGNYAKHWLRAGRVVTDYDTVCRYAVFFRDPEQANRHLKSKKTVTEVRQIPKRVSKISEEEILAAGCRYMDEVRGDEHARYLSWEHCYGFFQKHRRDPDEETVDLMCLHLAWYLASWGMLRGSAFLLQKDYRVHHRVVRLLVSEQYADLHDCSAEKMAEPETIRRIMELSSCIVEIYREMTTDLGAGEGKTASDTLVTKILLGTMGCAPAYDRYFQAGLAASGIAVQSYGSNSMQQIANFYLEHLEALEQLRRKISCGRISYTPMKIVDMCIWQIGFDREESQ